MSSVSRICRIILMAHGLMNIGQGIYSLISPKEYAELAGDMFAGAPDKVLQSIGLGGIGVGWYELIFAYQNNRALILATIPMRLLFAFIMLAWGNTGVVGYEVGAAIVCGLALMG